MIVPMTKTQLAVLLAVAVAAPAVNAHGSMSLPKPTFSTQGGDTTQPGLNVDSSALTAPSGMSFTTDPTSNTNAFNAAIKTSAYKSVKDLIAAKGVPIPGANKECGLTTPTGTKQPLPAQVEWSHGSGEGFTPSHEGPCEVWCDNVLAFSDGNCAKNFPSAPAKLPYDKSKCVGKSVLKTIWLALHSPTWQAYINCAAIEGGSASSGDDSTTPAATTPTATTKAPSTGGNTKTPKPTTKTPSTGGNTKTPKPTTTAPATTEPPANDADEDCEDELPIAGDEDCDDDLDIADTPAPAAGGSDEYATPAPAAGGSDEYATPAPASGGEVGGEADADEDCEDELPIAGEEDCDDELEIPDTQAPAAATTKAPKATKAPKKTKAPKTPKPSKTKKTKEAVRTSDLGFEELSADDDVAAVVST